MLRCLDAVLAQDYDDYEVLVLDNESTDGTAEACAERGRRARVPVRVEVVAGTVGYLRNRAAELANGELLAFTDSDCLPTPGWLTAAAAAFGEGPDVGVVTGPTWAEGTPPRGHPGGRWPAFIQVTEPTGRFESCNVVYRRDALRDADGFDEIVGHFWEDAAAGWSVLRKGWKAAWAPGAVVYHDVTHPGFAWHLRRGQRQANAARVVRRYPELRRGLLFGRYFVSDRSFFTCLSVAGLVLAIRDRRALALALPYALFYTPRGLYPMLPVTVGEVWVHDVAGVIGAVRGSVRHRSLVL